MTDLANAAVAASIIVGMISIPAASQTVDTANSVQPALGNISSGDQIPEQESTELTSDSFTREVESAFSSFSTEISSGKIEGKLENPQESLEIDSEPGRTEWKLRTPEGELTVEETSTSIEKTVSTPEGTLEVVERNGGVSRNFEGSDREAVEETMSQLMEKLEQKQKQYRQKADRARIRKYSEGLNISVKPGRDDPEKVTVANQMSSSIDLSGWKITNDNGNSYSLDEKLEPGQSIHIYHEEEDSEELENVTETGDDIYEYDGLDWDQSGGDVATLYDSTGKEITSFSY